MVRECAGIGLSAGGVTRRLTASTLFPGFRRLKQMTVVRDHDVGVQELVVFFGMTSGISAAWVFLSGDYVTAGTSREAAGLQLQRCSS